MACIAIAIGIWIGFFPQCSVQEIDGCVRVGHEWDCPEENK